MNNVRRLPRPPAMWLFVPRWERAGYSDVAHAFRRYSKSLSNIEFDYYRGLLETSAGCTSARKLSSDLAAIHERYLPELHECEKLLPRIGSGYADVTAPPDQPKDTRIHQSA